MATQGSGDTTPVRPYTLSRKSAPKQHYLFSRFLFPFLFFAVFRFSIPPFSILCQYAILSISLLSPSFYLAIFLSFSSLPIFSLALSRLAHSLPCLCLTSCTISLKGIVRFWSRWKAPPYEEIHRPPPCCTTRTGQYLLD